MILKDFKASPLQLTQNGLSVLHCAAQFERGTLAIESFLSNHQSEMDVNQRDNYGCAPLHFAVMNM